MKSGAILRKNKTKIKHILTLHWCTSRVTPLHYHRRKIKTSCRLQCRASSGVDTNVLKDIWNKLIRQCYNMALKTFMKLHSFSCQIRQNQSVSFKAEAAMLDSQVVQYKNISLPPGKSNSISPTGRSYVLNHFRFYLTSVTIKRMGWVHVVRQRDTFKHGWLFVVCVVMHVGLREPNFAACDWVSR